MSNLITDGFDVGFHLDHSLFLAHFAETSSINCDCIFVIMSQLLSNHASYRLLSSTAVSKLV